MMMMIMLKDDWVVSSKGFTAFSKQWVEWRGVEVGGAVGMILII